MIEDIVKVAALAEAHDCMTDVRCKSGAVATLLVFEWHRTFDYNRVTGEIIATGVC